MKASHSFSKLLLSVLFLPAFLSADLINLEYGAESTLEMSTFHHCANNSKKNHHGTVFASYRNNADLTVLAAGNVLFNEKNSNKGDGISYQEDGVFTIKKSGFYLINYGLASIGTAGEAGAAFGFNLIKTRDGNQEIVDSVLTNSSSAIVLFLKENDSVTVASQKVKTILIAGSLPPLTTSLTDTAHISFLRLDR